MKFAAFKKIQQLGTAAEQAPLSIKYQVLCEATAMVGVIKQEQKSTFASKEVVVDLTARPQQIVPPPRIEDNNYRMMKLGAAAAPQSSSFLSNLFGGKGSS